MAAPSTSAGAWLRCPHCAGPLSKEMETSRWTVPPLVRDSFSMIGSAVGGTTSGFYGYNYGEFLLLGSGYGFYVFNYVMPNVRRWIKGPMWLQFLVGAPPVMVLSSVCAGLAGGAIPALAQLASSSYHAATSSPTLLHQSPQDNTVHKPGTSPN